MDDDVKIFITMLIVVGIGMLLLSTKSNDVSPFNYFLIHHLTQ